MIGKYYIEQFYFFRNVSLRFSKCGHYGSKIPSYGIMNEQFYSQGIQQDIMCRTGTVPMDRISGEFSQWEASSEITVVFTHGWRKGIIESKNCHAVAYIFMSFADFSDIFLGRLETHKEFTEKYI